VARLKEGKGFLLLANLALSSFQRRLGSSLAMSPGDEMLVAINAAQEAGLPFSFIDREVQVTLRRAWSKSNLMNKAKLMAARNREVDDLGGWAILLVALAGAITCWERRCQRKRGWPNLSAHIIPPS